MKSRRCPRNGKRGREQLIATVFLGHGKALLLGGREHPANPAREPGNRSETYVQRNRGGRYRGILRDHRPDLFLFDPPNVSNICAPVRARKGTQ